MDGAAGEASATDDSPDLSLDVAEKVLGSNLDRGAQERLVNQYIDELGELGG